MNKYRVTLAYILCIVPCLCVTAQNVQFHYDFGRYIYNDDISERPNVTTTFELFKPDNWGNTYMFIDLDYYSSGISNAYLEISRELTLFSTDSKLNSLAAHIEYDGGIGSNRNLSMANRYQPAALAGAAWNWHSNDFNHTFSLQALYKQYFKGEHSFQKSFSSFQLTAVWGLTFGHGMWNFSGFLDCWSDNSVNGNFVIVSEPQLWFNFAAITPKTNPLQHLSIGTEVELSNNFVYTDIGGNNKLFAIPTIACKWSF